MKRNATLILLTCAITTQLVGCATIYKSTAGDYVDASKQLIEQLRSSESYLSDAKNIRLAEIISNDKTCPVSRLNGIYVRPGCLDLQFDQTFFTSFIISATSMNSPYSVKLRSQCKKFYEDNLACKDVTHTCFSQEESQCIDQLRHFYETNSQKQDATEEDKKTWMQFDSKLRLITYGGRLADSYVALSFLEIFSSYLDVLGTAADGQEQDLQKRINDLSTRVQNVSDKYKSLTGNDLLSNSDLSGGQQKLKAIGIFFQDIQVMAQTAKDTETIKSAVTKFSPDVKLAMQGITQIVIGDIDVIGQIENAQGRQDREQLAHQFKEARNSLERRIILQKLQNLNEDNTPSLMQAANSVFDKALQSHNTLIQLINKPNNDQLEQIRAQEFASFRSAVEDFANLLLVLK